MAEFLLEALNYVSDPYLMDAEEALGLMDARPVSVIRRKRIIRTALIAAALACLMTATAFAAVYFGMSYRFTQEGEQQSYTYGDGAYSMHTAVYEATMILRFDGPAESNLYAFRANWLPSEPSVAWSLYARAEDMARADLGMIGLVKTAEERARVDAELALIFAELGVSAEEARNWYTYYDADTTVELLPDGSIGDRFDVEDDIPYQIELHSDLYQFDLLAGYDGGAVELVKEEKAGDWHTLWLNIDRNVPEEVTHFSRYSLVLRFNQAEGYLLQVIGTLDCGTLGKIAENVEVLRTDMKTVSDGEGSFAVITLGHG